MSTEIAKKPGRKRIKVDKEQVFNLASTGMGRMDICRSIGISHDTLMRNIKRSAEFADALHQGESQAVKKVNSKLMQNIEEGQFQAIQFFLRNKRPEEWNRDQKTVVEHSINLNDIIRDRKVLIDKGQVRDRTEQEPKKAIKTTYKEVGPVVLNQKTPKNEELNVAPSSKPSNNEQLEGGD
tara:strand:- start:1013 stop:1555 length:543 start_codon:yes stop_codon:yes gene_type:complete